MAQSQQKPPQRVWRCFTCGKVVQAVRNAAGQIVCGQCGNAVTPELAHAQANSSSSVIGMPTPQPKPAPKPAAAQADARRPQRPATGPVRVPAKGAARPVTPAEAIAQSSGSWIPNPPPPPSHDIPDAPSSPTIPAAAGSSRKGLLIGGAVALVAVLGVVAFVLANRNKNTPGPQQASSANPTPPVQITPTPTPAPETSVKPTPPAPTSTESSTPAPAAHRQIDLLSIVDLSRDVANGQWKQVPGGISSDESKWSKLCLPYDPPAEYDFRVEFTRASANNESLVQIFRDNGHPCTWVVNGWKGTACAFNIVGNSKGGLENNPTAVRGLSVPAGERHVSIVKVRANYIEAYLDDKMVAHYDTDGTDLNMSKDWNLGRPKALGIGSNQSATVFHAIDVIEVTGQGKVNPSKLVLPPTTQSATTKPAASK